MNRGFLIVSALLWAIVTAHAAPTCTVSTSGVAFGSFNPLPGASAETTGTISVTCTGSSGDTASYTITITQGLGSFSARKMFYGSANLIYNLYRDSGCTQVWGDSSGGTYVVSDSMTLTSSSTTKNYAVYGRIAGGQNTDGAGSYSDSLVVNLSY
jgi:spore coat protein U-like protein